MTTTVKTNEVLKLEKSIIILNDRIKSVEDIITLNVWTRKLNLLTEKLNKLQ
jgi:hypothetical protein